MNECVELNMQPFVYEHLQKRLVADSLTVSDLAGFGDVRRGQIWTLLVRLKLATRGDPLCFSRVPAADCCLRNTRPSALAQHPASSSSFRNFGTLFCFFMTSLSFRAAL